MAITLAIALSGMALAAPAKKPLKASSKSSASSKTSASSKKKTRGATTRKSTPAAPRQTVQALPSPDRYREIQQALAAKGYLKSEPSGAWDQESAEAMRQFQTEQNLPATGKLSAASLIGLGLGGSTQELPHSSGPVTN